MADDVAKVSLTFDASGAQKGAADYKAAGDSVISTERAIEAASTKTAGTVTQSERTKAAARQASTQAAKALGQDEVAAAGLAGNVWDIATKRILTSLTSQQRMLDNYAREFDPLGSKVERLQRRIDTLNDVVARKGPESERAARQLTVALERLAAAQTALGDAGAGEALAQQTKMLDDYARRLDPFGTAVANAKRELEDLNKVAAQGGPNAQRAATLVPAAQRSVDAAQKAQADAGIDPALADQKKMIEDLARAYDPLGTAVTNATKRVQDLQKVIIEGGPHAAEATKLQAHALAELAEAQAKQAAGDPKLLAERKALEAEFNPLKARTDEYHAALDRLQKSVAMGIVSDMQAEAQRKRLTAQFEQDEEHIDRAEKGMTRLGHSTAGMSREMLVLSHEMLMGNFTRLGGSLMVMAELAGGVGAALGKVARFLMTPMGLAITGIAAVTAGVVTMGVAAERSQRRLEDMRNQLSGFRPDFAPAAEMAQEASRHLAAQTDLGTEGARQMVGAIVTSPQYRGTEKQTVQLGKLFNDLGKQMGVDASKAAEYAKEAFESPSKLAAELGKTLTALDPPFQKHLADLEAEGKKAQATNELLRRLAESVKPVQTNVTELQKEWQKLNTILFDSSKGGKSFADVVGGAVDLVAASAIRQIGILIEGVKTAYQWLETHTPDWLKKAAMYMVSHGPIDVAKTVIDTVTGTGSGQTGGKVVENDGAVGLFQLRKPAAADVGMAEGERYDYGANLRGGVDYLVKQYVDAKKDLDTATRAFNQGAGGAAVGKGYKYLEAVKAQDPNRLPPDVKRDIEQDLANRYAQLVKGPDGEAITRRLEQIAMQENRGHHFVAEPGGATTTTAPTGGTAPFTGTEPAPTGQVVDLPNEASQQAREEYKKLPAVSRELEENRQAVQRTTAGLIADVQALQNARAHHKTEAARLAQEAVTRDQETLRLLQAQRSEILTPAQRAAREATESLRPLSAEPGAARQVEELRLKQQQQERQSGYSDPAANAQERAALQAKLTAELNDTTRAMDQQIAAQQRLIPMYEAGGQAAEHLANVEKARIEALKYGARDTDAYRIALEKLIATYDRETQGKRDTQAAQSIARMKQETEQLQLQLQLIGATNAERERQMAMLGQRQQLGLGPNNTPSDEQQRSINLAGQNADRRAQLRQTEAAYRELEQTGEHIFSTFENALTTPLREGETAAMRFKDVMVSVIGDIEKEFLKLAVINPLMNALFGGDHRPEIGDVGGVLGGLFGGGKDKQGGGSPLGMIGKLLGLGGQQGGGTGIIDSGASGGLADRQFDAALSNQLVNASLGGSGAIIKGMGGTWTMSPAGGAAPAAAPVLAAPALQGKTPAEIIQQEHDQHERLLGGQRSDLGLPGTDNVLASADMPDFGQPQSFVSGGIASTSVGDNLYLAFNEYLRKNPLPAANDNGVLATSTNRLVSSLGDQVGAIDKLVDTGHDQIGSIGNLVGTLGGGQGQVQGGGLIGKLVGSIGGDCCCKDGGPIGSLFGGSGAKELLGTSEANMGRAWSSGGASGADSVANPGGGWMSSLGSSIGNIGSSIGKWFSSFGGNGGRDALGSYTGTTGDPIPGGDAISGQMASMSDSQLAEIANTAPDVMGAGWSSGAASAADSAFSAAAALHTGGLVGIDGSPRQVPSGVFFNAPRLHSGLGANEFAAILEKGERVLTGRQQQQVSAAANNNKADGHTFVFNFPNTTNPDGFRRSAQQVAAHVGSTLQRAQARGNG